MSAVSLVATMSAVYIPRLSIACHISSLSRIVPRVIIAILS
jgi:hypothetical protein